MPFIMDSRIKVLQILCSGTYILQVPATMVSHGNLPLMKSQNAGKQKNVTSKMLIYTPAILKCLNNFDAVSNLIGKRLLGARLRGSFCTTYFILYN